MLDTDLATALGMADIQKVRPLIRANINELESFGGLSALCAESSGGRAGTAYYLNEKQALPQCSHGSSRSVHAGRRSDPPRSA